MQFVSALWRMLATSYRRSLTAIQTEKLFFMALAERRYERQEADFYCAH